MRYAPLEKDIRFFALRHLQYFHLQIVQLYPLQAMNFQLQFLPIHLAILLEFSLSFRKLLRENHLIVQVAYPDS